MQLISLESVLRNLSVVYRGYSGMIIGTGFDYGLFDEVKFDETPQVTQFEDSVKAEANNPRIRFVLDDTIYDDLVLSVSSISQDAEITSGFVSIKLSNTDGSWSTYRGSDIIGKSCRVGLYFLPITAIGLLYLFTGTVEDVTFNRAEVNLQLRDKMAPMLEKELGNGQAPVDYYSTWYSPGDLVWHILTEYGELTDLKDDTNPDINYSSWTTWDTDTNAKNYQLKARFTGDTIQSALSEIAYLTNSLIWVDGEGKIQFAMFSPPYTGDEYFDHDNCIDIDLSVSRKDIINDVRVRYGFSVANDGWENSTNDIDSASITKHGRRQVVIESKTVWHYTLQSAVSFRDDFLDIWASASERIMMKTTMMGFLFGLGSALYVTEALKNLNNRSYWIDKVVSLDIYAGSVEFEGRWAGL